MLLLFEDNLRKFGDSSPPPPHVPGPYLDIIDGHGEVFTFSCQVLPIFFHISHEEDVDQLRREPAVGVVDAEGIVPWRSGARTENVQSKYREICLLRLMYYSIHNGQYVSKKWLIYDIISVDREIISISIINDRHFVNIMKSI